NGIAHALEHHVQKQRFELPAGFFQTLIRIRAGAVLEFFHPLHIERKLLLKCHIVADAIHHSISSSARSDPAALSASRIDIRSWVLAPSALSVLITSVRSAPSTM